IRDLTVTGVQTCALPISGMLHCTQNTDCRRESSSMVKRWDETMKKLIYTSPQQVLDWLKTGSTFLHFEPTELFKTREEEEPLRRSEERRVGKGWRNGWCE